MMLFGLQLNILLNLSLQGPVLSRVWVNQWSTLSEYRVGDMAALHCAIYSDKETIENCHMKWVMRDPNNPDISIKMKESKLYADRVSVQSKDTDTAITIRNLGLNDTEPLCIIDCFIDGRLKRNIGQEGSLKIVELFNPHDEKESSPSLTWLTYFLFAVNVLVFLVVIVIFCTIMCRRLLRK